VALTVLTADNYKLHQQSIIQTVDAAIAILYLDQIVDVKIIKTINCHSFKYNQK